MFRLWLFNINFWCLDLFSCHLRFFSNFLNNLRIILNLHLFNRRIGIWIFVCNVTFFRDFLMFTAILGSYFLFLLAIICIRFFFLHGFYSLNLFFITILCVLFFFVCPHCFPFLLHTLPPLLSQPPPLPIEHHTGLPQRLANHPHIGIQILIKLAAVLPDQPHILPELQRSLVVVEQDSVDDGAEVHRCGHKLTVVRISFRIDRLAEEHAVMHVFTAEVQ